MPQKSQKRMQALYLDKLGMNPLHAWKIGVDSIESNICLYGDINTPYVLQPSSPNHPILPTSERQTLHFFDAIFVSGQIAHTPASILKNWG